ncbi:MULTISPECIES: aminopeptidase PepB [Idiomarina]|uniref:aminopeptidase PepB n=1 Tax=Idiomarina TaxID=135575 RepID=UPI00129D1FA9|nr:MULTISPECIES: aminopeptidase PepB [Idiomarina]MRJ42503.1 aminopeptidase PepB [Idiomarina sp. FeN1]NCU58117.1 aminopeptidase PepB [Idiomarina sp. FenA--70]NCU60815.1 aminopeptidase PepB [Idiomarina sp. FenBw--71]UUN13699.1 aminopeptidase PepB [Idiomarina loihiensis]
MSSTVPVFLESASTTTTGGWKASAAVIMNERGAVISLTGNEANDLRKIQRAGRQLDNLGINAVSLRGDNWNLEQQWAFAKGFTDTLSKNKITWANHEQQLNLLQKHANWVRELINLPPEAIYPEALAQRVADKLTELAPAAISVRKVVGDELLAEQRMGIHTVGRASVKPPVMLVVDYNPSKDPKAEVDTVLIGKGITFDSGGLSIKSSEGMLAMKCDMGGAATVAGALGYAIEQGLNKRVQLVLCCAENLIDGRAYKLGDIITYKNGTTVEIVNTDAEGRLVLADGLIYAAEVNAKHIIDAATLTGAAQVAVGTEYNALFSVDDDYAQQALDSAAANQELLWRLPLQPWHRDNCPSAFADTANSRPQKGGGAGGASNAAGFLLRFAPNEGAGWLHFDIAAAYHGSANGMCAAGATALGFRTIAATLLN